MKDKLEYLIDCTSGLNYAILIKSDIFGILESRTFRKATFFIISAVASAEMSHLKKSFLDLINFLKLNC